MGVIITSELFGSYLDCPTRSFFLSIDRPGGQNAYTDWLRRKEQEYLDCYTRQLVGPQQFSTLTKEETVGELSSKGWNTCFNIQVRTDNLDTRIQLIERVLDSKKKPSFRIIPIRLTFSNKITVKHRLMLAFDTFVLGKALGQEVNQGKIIHGDNNLIATVKTNVLQAKVTNLVAEIETVLSSNSPPILTLNQHCSECLFQLVCRQKAIELEDLSLLPGMSEKARKQLCSRGIRTIGHLSYTYRPRRKPKHSLRQDEKYEHSLKAMSIREHKIYVVGSERLEIKGTPVYLDVEGIPDHDFYYLIGLRFNNGTETVQRSLWAETAADEKEIWNAFLTILSKIESPILIHYGSYEAAFLKQMSTRYGIAAPTSDIQQIFNNSINLVSFIYSRIYFPTYSNGLKDIARYLGFQWSEPDASGIQSIVWRDDWEDSDDSQLKSKLIQYNAEDCEALERVVGFVLRISNGEATPDDKEETDTVNVADIEPTRGHIWKKIDFQNSTLEEVYRTGYWDYQREKITVRSHKKKSLTAKKTASVRRTEEKPNKVIYWEAPAECPWCGNKELSVHRHSEKTLLDVRFSKSGVKKWVTKYIFSRYICRACDSPTFSNLNPEWSRPHYGPNVRALAIYLNIGLRVSESRTTAILDRLLGIHIPRGVVHRFKKIAAEYYYWTYGFIQQALEAGPVVHCDETKIFLGNKVGFVWVFTNPENVKYVYSPDRSASIVQQEIRDFKGVLVSDFFAVYDSFPWPQQKCLIHLIRDLNDELMNEPFNDEIKQLTADFARLLRSIVATIDRFGLRARHLHKHKIDVDRFFSNLSKCPYQSETANKYKKRFEKNREKLFTFLDYDNVPWNNNAAEHAIKPIAHLRRDLGAVSTPNSIQDYLILLSVRETCKLQGIDFLSFLRSRETDLDEFKVNIGRRKQKTFVPLDADVHFDGM